MLEITEKIEPYDWMLWPETADVMAAIGVSEGQSLFVGGSVRNALMGVAVEDVDIATKLTPDAVMAQLKAAGVKVIPTGIAHGTVTAVIGRKTFEITTLRRDVETDGRHAVVGFTDDWVVDAQRRDFTMNTLLCDLRGNVYDPIGTGVVDVKARKVVFVGDPAARIAEDYLRILRFFRFQAFYGAGDMDAGALAACRAASAHISTLSRERITSELLKILSINEPQHILKIMFDCNVLDVLSDVKYTPEVLQKLCVSQVEQGAVKMMPRLFVLGGNQPRFHDGYLRFSHAQKSFLVKLVMAYNPQLFADERALKKAIYYHGADLMMQGYLLVLANGLAVANDKLFSILKNWEAPKCPITGKTLIAEGFQTGPDLGQELERRREEWLDEVI